VEPRIEVRPAREDDLEALLVLYGQLHEQPPEPAQPALDVLRAILAQPGRHLLVATSDRLVVGTADLLIAANLTHGARPWAIIENVVVAESQRGGGVGALLMRELVAAAHEAGCYRVVLTSDKQRDDAHAFYRALGFEAVAEGFKLYLDD
jgi:predicted N-acetyltransferase YhbS